MKTAFTECRRQMLKCVSVSKCRQRNPKCPNECVGRACMLLFAFLGECILIYNSYCNEYNRCIILWVLLLHQVWGLHPFCNCVRTRYFTICSIFGKSTNFAHKGAWLLLISVIIALLIGSFSAAKFIYRVKTGGMLYFIMCHIFASVHNLRSINWC